ncbi:DUF962 domain-containing protein [Erythrobacter arachoides]|uniref:DUF962 domain-containing protein n=1 Tax=Aurantiacibacter arachoides TaxID=1850444 RepID=A0A845A3G3_9SPHN|nr:Mpo1-like protein [Aurantiacibacter arachoides]MXO93467.1 DUF962 domain-containing protein [Aurantiacibacter arachoides]GGD49161.1 membrane protein [Aurantiacibacter arachoides]
MTNLVEALASYGEYHRDHRNVATHALGIPLIVLAVEVLLSRPTWDLGGWVATPAMVGSVLAALWYLRLDLKVGLLMAVLLALLCSAGHWIAQVSTVVWLAGGIGLFVAGWTLQFLGHHYEGRKPAFLDDIKSLLVGPLFVVCEGLFAMGLLGDLRRQVHAG